MVGCVCETANRFQLDPSVLFSRLHSRLRNRRDTQHRNDHDPDTHTYRLCSARHCTHACARVIVSEIRILRPMWPLATVRRQWYSLRGWRNTWKLPCRPAGRVGVNLQSVGGVPRLILQHRSACTSYSLGYDALTAVAASSCLFE